MRQNSLILQAVLILWLAGAGWGGCTRSPKTIAFVKVSPSARETRRLIEADRAVAQAYQPSALASTIIDQITQLNRQIDRPIPPDGLDDSEEKLSDLRDRLNQLGASEGSEAVRRLALFLTESFWRSLRALLEAAQNPLIVASLIGNARPPAPADILYDRLIDLSGNFLPLAVANGLISEDLDGHLQLAEDAEFFIWLAFKMRFLRYLPESAPADLKLVSSFEETWYDRWVVERSKTAPLERKLQAIESLSQRDPGYPARRARGVVLFQSGDGPGAVQAFQDALQADPNDSLSQSFLKLAQRATNQPNP